MLPKFCLLPYIGSPVKCILTQVPPGKTHYRKQINITWYAGYHAGNGTKLSVSELFFHLIVLMISFTIKKKWENCQQSHKMKWQSPNVKQNLIAPIPCLSPPTELLAYLHLHMFQIVLSPPRPLLFLPTLHHLFSFQSLILRTVKLLHTLCMEIMFCQSRHMTQKLVCMSQTSG